MDKGDCYESAANLLTRKHLAGDDLTGWSLVHGVACNQGDEHGGEPMGHAWVEYTDPVVLKETTAQLTKLVEGKNVIGGFDPVEQARRTVSVVHDHSNGEQRELAAVLYYAVGNIDFVVRYDYEDMVERMLSSEHFGSWDLPAEWWGRAVL